MRKFRKLMSTVLAVSMVIPMLVGCGSSGGGATPAATTAQAEVSSEA